MSISQRQFEHLTEMGISLWQHRSQDNNSSESSSPEQTFIQVKLNELSKQQFFSDLLLSIDVSIGEITEQVDHLDLGLFNWFFVDASKQESPIQFQQNSLYTPALEQLSKRPELKKALWQTISQKLL